jgi:hypothetical protein
MMWEARTSISMSGRWKRACALQTPRHLSTLLKFDGKTYLSHDLSLLLQAVRALLYTGN